MTPGFRSPYRAELLDDLRNGRESWRLLEPLHYDSELVEARVVVPAGFASDGESIPGLLSGFVGHPRRKAGTLHDFLYLTHIFERRICDEMYREALLACNLDAVRADQRLAAVVFYGGRFWDNGPDRLVDRQDTAQGACTGAAGEARLLPDDRRPT